jgi:hypothetical protein
MLWRTTSIVALRGDGEYSVTRHWRYCIAPAPTCRHLESVYAMKTVSWACWRHQNDRMIYRGRSQSGGIFMTVTQLTPSFLSAVDATPTLRRRRSHAVAAHHPDGDRIIHNVDVWQHETARRHKRRAPFQVDYILVFGRYLAAGGVPIVYNLREGYPTRQHQTKASYGMAWYALLSSKSKRETENPPAQQSMGLTRHLQKWLRLRLLSLQYRYG